MNILFLSRDYPPNLIGGVGIYTLEISKALARMGHKVYVITQAVEYPTKYIDEGVIVFRIKPHPLRCLNFLRKRLPGTIERLEYSRSVFKKLKEVVPKYNIDIIESSEARFEGFWYFFFRRTPKLVIKLHTPESIALKLDNIYPDLDYKIRSILEERWIQRADRVVGLTQAVKDLVCQYYNISLDGAPLILNPVDIEFFKPKDSNINFKDNPIILYVGRLEFRKGVHVLIRAIPYVLREIPKAKFIFIGEDSGMKLYLINKVKEIGCSEHILIIDGMPRYKLREFYQRSTLCVLPSLWENHPYTALEAMACAKPVIVTNIGGFPEIIQNGFNGILVEAGSTKSLAAAIIKLLLDEKLCVNLGRNARKTIENRYCPEEIAGKTASIYAQLLDNNVT